MDPSPDFELFASDALVFYSYSALVFGQPLTGLCPDLYFMLSVWERERERKRERERGREGEKDGLCEKVCIFCNKENLYLNTVDLIVSTIYNIKKWKV